MIPLDKSVEDIAFVLTYPILLAMGWVMLPLCQYISLCWISLIRMEHSYINGKCFSRLLHMTDLRSQTGCDFFVSLNLFDSM